MKDPVLLALGARYRKGEITAAERVQTPVPPKETTGNAIPAAPEATADEIATND